MLQLSAAGAAVAALRWCLRLTAGRGSSRRIGHHHGEMIVGLWFAAAAAAATATLDGAKRRQQTSSRTASGRGIGGQLQLQLLMWRCAGIAFQWPWLAVIAVDRGIDCSRCPHRSSSWCSSCSCTSFPSWLPLFSDTGVDVRILYNFASLIAGAVWQHRCRRCCSK